MDGKRAPAHPDRVIATVTAQQHGLVTMRQMLAAGVGRGAIEHRVRCRRLIRIHRGVYALGHVHDSRIVRWMAAVLACGADAALSHHSAAALWDLRPSSATRIHVTIAGRAGRSPPAGIVVHRSTVLPPSELAKRDEAPVTSVARTLLDIAGTLRAPSLARAVERAEILELFDLTAVQQTLDRHRNHRGAKRLPTAIALHRDHEVTRSELEACCLALCEDNALRRPLVNRVVGGDEVDFLWPEQSVIVETDGRRTHRTHAAFEREARDGRPIHRRRLPRHPLHVPPDPGRSRHRRRDLARATGWRAAGRRAGDPR